MPPFLLPILGKLCANQKNPSLHVLNAIYGQISIKSDKTTDIFAKGGQGVDLALGTFIVKCTIYCQKVLFINKFR